MGKIVDYFKKKNKEELPLIARVDLAELQKQREENMQLKDKSILAAYDYTKLLPTLRLFYVSLEKFLAYGTDELKVGETYGISSPFRLPNDMSIEDACKVISYLSEMVEKDNNLEPACEDSVAMVSSILGLYGFDRVEGYQHGHMHAVSEYRPLHKIRAGLPGCEKIEGVKDLFTVGGDCKLFKKSNLSDRYFDWFTEGVSEQEVEDIYKKIRKEHLFENAKILLDKNKDYMEK